MILSKPRETTYRRLAVPLTVEELVVYRDDLAHATTEMNRLIAEKKEIDSTYNENIKEQRLHGAMLAASIESRSTSRDIPCDLYLDLSLKKAVLVRRDTGEVVETRELTDRELQLVIGQDVDKLGEDVYNALRAYERQIVAEQKEGIEDDEEQQ
jgi:hypothetical protein